MLVPPTAHLEGKRVLVVDDASETGETIKMAKEAIQKHRPTQVITAVLVRTGTFEPEYVASYFPGKVLFPWVLEEQEPEETAQKPAAGSKKRKRSK
jgi:hypoxanthine phosphoribosyltransferase